MTLNRSISSLLWCIEKEQCGQALALSEICLLHDGHFINDITFCFNTSLIHISVTISH